jgi:hypothetical protein
MSTEHAPEDRPTDYQREKRFLAKLRQKPLLRERFEAILELADTEEGKLMSADELEERLIQEVRKLGQETMQEWALTAHQRAGEQLLKDKPQARPRKKNS